jgi:hypothetical protein
VLLKSTPATAITTNTTAAAAAPATATLADALAQLTGRGVAAGGSSAQAVQNLVDMIATQPALAQQLKHLLSQPKEPSAFVEQFHLPYQQQVHQHSEPLVQQQQQQQQAAPAYANTGALNERDLLAHLLDRQHQQQQQQQQGGAAPSSDGVDLSPASGALRRAQLSVKFQALQAKLAARQAALQKLQNHMELQNSVFAGQQQQQQQQQNPAGNTPLTTIAPSGGSPAVTATAGTGAYGNGSIIGNDGIPAYSTADGSTNAAAGQTERREALLRLLAAKLQSNNNNQQQAFP